MRYHDRNKVSVAGGCLSLHKPVEVGAFLAISLTFARASELLSRCSDRSQSCVSIADNFSWKSRFIHASEAGNLQSATRNTQLSPRLTFHVDFLQKEAAKILHPPTKVHEFHNSHIGFAFHSLTHLPKARAIFSTLTTSCSSSTRVAKAKTDHNSTEVGERKKTSPKASNNSNSFLV
jgi:hypothetical protein